jgi:hypothetical protein
MNETESVLRPYAVFRFSVRSETTRKLTSSTWKRELAGVKQIGGVDEAIEARVHP